MCFIGGSALLADQLQPAERTRTQGFNDLLIGLSASLASFISGMLYDFLGFVPITWVGTLMSGILFVTTLVWAWMVSTIRAKKRESVAKEKEGCQSTVDSVMQGRQVSQPC